MTQQQAQTELQEIERIANGILRGDTIYGSKDMLISLPRGQRCGTLYKPKQIEIMGLQERSNKRKNIMKEKIEFQLEEFELGGINVFELIKRIKEIINQNK